MDFTTIQVANTINGFAIGLIKCTRDGSYSVVRVDRKNKFITISNHKTEAEARKAANKEWAADKYAKAA